MEGACEGGCGVGEKLKVISVIPDAIVSGFFFGAPQPPEGGVKSSRGSKSSRVPKVGLSVTEYGGRRF